MRVKYAVAIETVITEWGSMNTSHALSIAATEAPVPEACSTTWVCTMPANVVSSSIPNVHPAMRPAAPRPTPRQAKSGR